MEADAKKVYPLAVASHPGFNSTSVAGEIYCTECKGKLVHRFNSENAGIFWGCENWRPDDTNHTRYRFAKGVRELNEYDALKPNESIEEEADIGL